MSITTGALASAANFNAAFASKSDDNELDGQQTLNEAIEIAEVTTPSTPASGYGKIYFKSDGKPYYLNDSGVESLFGTGTGSGGTNFISNGDAESNVTTGWAVYADAAGTSPVDGTGGSASVTISSSATAPLVGTYSFLMVKDAVNRQGQGWSYAFTIDSAYKAKVLQVSFDYILSSGTFVAGSDSTSSDVTVWIYDVTNSQLIQPTTYKLFSNSSTLSSKFIANFQASSNSTSYRLIIHVGSTSASAYTLKVDSVSAAPSSYVYGTPITDWSSYTPAVSGFTTSAMSAFYRRVGDSIEIATKFTKASHAASEMRFGLPSGLTSADTSKIAAIREAGSPVISNANTSGFDFGTVLIEPSVTYFTFGEQGSSSQGVVKQNGNNFYGATDILSFTASCPIQGWSSNVQMSNDTDTRVISFSATKGSTQAVTANVTDVTFTTSKDSHGAWNGTVYTVPVPGDYQVSAAIWDNAAGTVVSTVYLNGSTTSKSVSRSDSGALAVNGMALLTNLKAGDTISLRSGTSLTLAGAGNLTINKLSGPVSIAATESIYMDAVKASGSVTASTTIPSWTVVNKDTHGAFNATTGVFTAPAAGSYMVSFVVATTSGSPQAQINKNGSVIANSAIVANSAGMITKLVTGLVAGDTISVSINSSLTISSPTAPYSTSISISRVGL